MLIKVIHYGFPVAAFAYFLITLTITVCTLQSTQALKLQDQYVRRNIVVRLILALAVTYISEAVAISAGDITGNGGTVEQDHMVYLIACTITFGVETATLADSKFPVWYPYYGTWLLGFLAELTLVSIHVLAHGIHKPEFLLGYITIVIRILRFCTLAALPSIYFGLRNDSKVYDNADAERQALLSKKLAAKRTSSEETASSSNGNGYGTTTQDSSDTGDNVSEAGSEDSWLADRRKAEELVSKRLQQDGNWFTYAKGFAIFLPHIWPFHDKGLQLRAILVVGCMFASNAMNVLVPASMGNMVDHLDKYLRAEPGEPIPNIWLPVVIYALLLFISGGACIGWIRQWLWLPVEQYSYDALSTASHAHIMSLSSDFHDSKTSSDLTQAISGGRSVADLLDTVCFQVIPMFIDLAIAFGYLSFLFGPYMGLIVITEAMVYMWATTKLVAARAEKRREFITIYRREWTIGQQSLDGWTNASLFNQIPYERTRYGTAVKDHMRSKRIYTLSSQAISAAQGAILAVGLLGALFLGVYQVSLRTRTLGNLTTLLVYWTELQGPLVFFSNMYRNISYSLMDSERLLELFQTKPTIVDKPDAKPLEFRKGQVEFNKVSFAYDERKPTLKEVSFSIPSGKTVALVGETGGGKTTILKLIDRFYDVKSGSISIDDQDLRDVTLESLRSKIGVVPQDPMLFNDSIMNNIRYARLEATDEEVFEACKAAAVHDKIMTFPDGYNSKVGDRGVKLSGGEKQRVAIARAMLKQPDIILLDEATSAVDTETEVLIQEGLKTLCTNRTTFIVAHRLSTVMRADKILVVMNGEIVEQGSHFDLINSKGKYHGLWSKQVLDKPGDCKERARSKSPKKHDGDLINDVDPTVCPTTLTEASEQAHSSQSKDEIKTVDDQATSAHEREASKLKPDAPEFVPFGGNTGKDGANDSASFATPAVAQILTFESPQNKSKKLKHRPYYARRQIAKSEPPSGSGSGSQESGDVAAVSSGERQALQSGSIQKRRGSAPNAHSNRFQSNRGRKRSKSQRLRTRQEHGISADVSVDEMVSAAPAPPHPMSTSATGTVM